MYTVNATVNQKTYPPREYKVWIHAFMFAEDTRRVSFRNNDDRIEIKEDDKVVATLTLESGWKFVS